MKRLIETKSGQETERQNERKTTFLEVCQGVLAGLFGVQSQKNRERDFKRGNGGDYILIYVVMVVALVIGMVVVVKTVVP